MNTDEKINISVTLSGWDLELFKKAMIIALPTAFNPRPRDNKRMVQLALWAFCRGVIRHGKRIDMPCIAEIRAENKQERDARYANIVESNKLLSLWSAPPNPGN